MLKYNLRTMDASNEYREIEFDNMYVSPDKQIISGETYFSYNLQDGQTAYINSDDDDTLKKVTLKVNNVLRQGYVLAETTFIVYENNGIKYFIDNKGQYHIENIDIKGDEDAEEMVFRGKITYEGVEYEIHFNSATTASTDEDSVYDYINTQDYYSITIPIKYYITDGVVEINGLKYDIDFTEEEPYIQIDGKTYYAHETNPRKWKHITEVVIESNSYPKLNVEGATCLKHYKYFTLEDNTTVYPIRYRDKVIGNTAYLRGERDLTPSETKELSDVLEKTNNTSWSGNPDLCFCEVVIGDSTYSGFCTDYDKTITLYDVNKTEETEETNYDKDGNAFTINVRTGKTFTLYDTWRATKMSDEALNLYFYENDLNLKNGGVINVVSKEKVNARCQIEKENNENEFIVFSGEKLYIKNDKWFVAINEQEHQLYHSHYLEDGGIITEIKYCVIDGAKHYFECTIEEGENKGTCKRFKESVYTTNGKELGEYDIKKKKYITYKNVDYFAVEEKYEDETVVEVIYLYDVYENFNFVIDIVNGQNIAQGRIHSSYPFGVTTKIANNFLYYDFYYVDPLFNPTRLDDMMMTQTENKLHMFVNTTFLAIPIVFSADQGINLYQEDIVAQQLYNAEIGKSLNRIVDMERDVYTPASGIPNKDDENITGWTFGQLVRQIKFHPHFRVRDMETWDVIEDYEKDGNTSPSWNVDNYQGHEPSDLLYYLNFTDDDVIYQKSKLSKTFLRLSIYDSKDAHTQSLLCTSTVFMDADRLYQIYISNSNGETKYKCGDDEMNYITVKAEPTTFDEDKRLDCTFTIDNRLESKTSSEGFYLHIFKEYSSSLHSRKVYMKVEFNHAGEGKKINFFPKHKNSDYMTEGIPLDQLYDALYIPMYLQFDEVNHQYHYYFDTDSNLDIKIEDGVLHFNLYEVKIKDES